MTSLFLKLDLNFPDDDKIVAAGLDGAGLYVQACCMAKRLLTDVEPLPEPIPATGKQGVWEWTP